MRRLLPRPAADPEFAEALLLEVLAEGLEREATSRPDGPARWVGVIGAVPGQLPRRRLYYVSGALAGAAALALSAALGWRRLVTRGETGRAA